MTKRGLDDCDRCGSPLLCECGDYLASHIIWEHPPVPVECECKYERDQTKKLYRITCGVPGCGAVWIQSLNPYVPGSADCPVCGKFNRWDAPSPLGGSYAAFVAYVEPLEENDEHD